MQSNLVSTNEINGFVREFLVAMPDAFDEPATVALVEGDFNPKDQESWPADSTASTPLVATDPWEINFDVVSGKYFFVAPDPDGGWDFTGFSDDVSFSGFTVRATTSGRKMFANKFTAPVPTTESTDHIVLPYIACEVGEFFPDGTTPYAVP